MINQPTTASTDQLDSLLGQVVDEYLEQLAQGELPDIESYAERHPEIASLIRKTFPALQLVGQSVAEVERSQGIDLTRNKQLGDFRLLRKIGSGGMGYVYEAEQLSMGRKVAVKILPMAGAMQEKSLQRFRNEVRAAASLDHANIVSVYFVGEDRGVHYFAMQLIRGQSLAEAIGQIADLQADNATLNGDSISEVLSGGERPIGDVSWSEPAREALSKCEDDALERAASTEPVVQAHISTASPTDHGAEFFQSAARLGIQAAEALQHAHEQGVLHRDIKPANLMLDADAQLYITDFGLARIETDVAMTMTGDLIGTLRYMSPEQALANRLVIDHRSDIYSLGVTLYELLTLQPPFSGKDRQAILHQIAFDDPVKLRHVNRSIPHELETIVLKAIEKNPDDRYDTAEALVDDLRAFLEHRPIKAKPPTLFQRSTKWSRRHRPLVWAVATSSALLLVTAVVMLAVSNWFVASERNLKVQQAQRAVHAERLAKERLAQVDQSLGQTLEAIDRMLSRVSDDLYGTPGLTPFRRSLHEDALELCLNLKKDHPADSRIRRQAGTISMSLAYVNDSLGDRPEAMRLMRGAISEFERLMDETPTNRQNQLDLARAYRQLGYHITDTEKSLELSRRSVALLESLVARYPNVSEHKSELLSSYSAMALCLRSREQTEALVYIQRAIELGESDPSLPKGHVGSACWTYASMLRKQKRTQAAEQGYRKAISYFQEASKDESTVQVHFRSNLGACYKDLAQLLAQAGKLDEADRAYRESIAVLAKVTTEFPSMPKYQRLLANSEAGLVDLLMQTGRNEEASTLVGKQEPQTVEEYIRRAKLYEQLEDYDKAIEDYDKAIELFPAQSDSLTYVNRGKLLVEVNDFDNALADFRTAYEKSDNSDAVAKAVGLFSRSLSGKGDFDAAVAIAQLAIERAPNDKMPHVALCEAKLGLHEYEEALKHIAAAIALQPESWLYKRQGAAHFGLRQFDLALAALNTALEKKPDDLSTVTWLGTERITTCPDEEFRMGIKALADRAVELNDGSAEARSYRAVFLVAMNEWELARKDLDVIVSDEDATYYSLYQTALLALGDDDVSRYGELCQKMLSKCELSNNVRELYFTAWTCSLAPNALDDYSPAIESAERVLNIEPNDASHNQSLGAVLFRAGRFEEAVKHLNHAVESDREANTSSAYGWYFLAMTHHELGNEAEARDWLDKAVTHTEYVFDTDRDDYEPVPWNRRLTLELLHQEATTLIEEAADKSS